MLVVYIDLWMHGVKVKKLFLILLGASNSCSKDIYSDLLIHQCTTV